MADDVRFEISIHSAELVKIFDTLKNTQDVYVQLVRVYPDGREKEFARTATRHGGDLHSTWDDESFVVNSAGGRTLKVRVYAEHFWRVDVLCGEAELDFASLASSASRARMYNLQIKKKGAATGNIRCTIGPLRAETSASASIMASIVARPSTAPLAEKLSREELVKLLNRPEELEEHLRQRFRQLAKHVSPTGQRAMRPEDCKPIALELSETLGVPNDVFGDINQMFWRFEVSGQGLLYEDEGVRMALCMLRNYRDSISGPKGANAQLSRAIRMQQVSDTYDVVRELGRGGQGIALLAKNKASGQEVVVKMYAKTNQKEAVEEISQEFELLMTLKHPKIARVFDIFQDWANVYIVQEPYFGGDLTKAVQNAYNAQVAVDEKWVAEVMFQVLMGVEFLHKNGVVHSDLKEPNVMVASHADWRSPQVIVIDFGLANKFSSRSGVGGTPGYMPPEVWEWGLWTPRGDVFSIGVMLFTVRTGKAPYNPDGRKGLEEIKQATKEVDAVMDRGSPQLKELVKSMLNKKFIKRPIVSQVLRDPWFNTKERGQALDTQALQNLARQRQRTDLYRAFLADVAGRQNLAQLKELNELFLRLDVNNDGSISAEEMRQGLKDVWRQDDIDRLLAVLGINDGGEVSYDQFLGELLAAKAPEENAMIHKFFVEADTQGRGYLGPDELAKLAERPAIVQIFGSKEAALQQIRAMDPRGRGRVTFDEFKRALQGGSNRDGDAPDKRRCSFKKGEAAQYWSKSHGVWVPCVVTDVREDAVAIDCKPGYWLSGEQLEQLRPARAAEPSSPSYREGQSVQMWSTTYSTWIPCRVTRVDAATGAVQVDQKPGYWLRGNELATRLKPAPAGAGGIPSSSCVGGRVNSSAATAGVGRQLLDGALAGLTGSRVR